ncbi:hypothetical protein D3C78_1652910 [compost metagenome]
MIEQARGDLIRAVKFNIEWNMLVQRVCMLGIVADRIDVVHPHSSILFVQVAAFLAKAVIIIFVL